MGDDSGEGATRARQCPWGLHNRCRWRTGVPWGRRLPPGILMTQLSTADILDRAESEQWEELGIVRNDAYREWLSHKGWAKDRVFVVEQVDLVWRMMTLRCSSPSRTRLDN